MSEAIPGPKSGMQKVLDVVERVGNRVPHPAVIFLLLILGTMVVAHVLSLMGVSATFEQYNETTGKLEQVTQSVRSLWSAEGVRFLYNSMIPNFMSFTAVGLLIAAMIGAGVAEESRGLKFAGLALVGVIAFFALLTL
ncbi:MAG: AbgT family transporter, partial [bacterium]